MQDKTKTILPLVVAVVLGIVSVVIINRYITSKTTVPEVKKVKVIIAAKPIVSSQIISMDQLGVKEVPENATSDVNIIVPYSGTPERTYEEIDRLKVMIAGRKAIRNISIGSPLLWTDLKEVESQALSDIVSKNKRAVTIPVDQLSAVGYNIIAGDKVDIVATKESSCGGSNTVSIPNQAGAMRDLMDLNQSPIKVNESEGKSFVIMQNVLVLAIGQDYNTFSGRSQQQGKSFSSVTLEVSLEEALMLTHARQNATLSLILRNPASTQRFEFDKLPVVDCSNIRTNIAPKLDKIRASEENISEMSSQKQNNP